MATIKNSVMYGVSLCVSARTESEWADSNPVLKPGEIAVSTKGDYNSYAQFSDGEALTNPSAGTGAEVRIKIGDGTSKWSALRYTDHYRAADISKIAALAAAGIYAVEQRCKTLEEAKTSLETAKTNLETRCDDLEARCNSLENSVGTMAEALLKLTSRLIENIRQ